MPQIFLDHVYSRSAEKLYCYPATILYGLSEQMAAPHETVMIAQ